MAGDDDFDLTKYVLQLSKKIARFTKDYVGLPFSNSTQLPFSIDARPQARSAFYGTTKKWQKGDPLIGFHTFNDRKKMVLNLPDGSTMLDMCFPGWEIAVLDQHDLDHFFARRYLFGDYYGHLLNGRPLDQTKGANVRPAGNQDDIQAAMARQAEIFQQRKRSISQAAEEQQRRGVPFDAHPVANSPDIPIGARASQQKQVADNVESPQTRQERGSMPRSLTQVIITTRSVRDATSGVSTNRLHIAKQYSNGETEVMDQTSKTPLNGEVDDDLEALSSSQLYGKLCNSDARATSDDESEVP